MRPARAAERPANCGPPATGSANQRIAARPQAPQSTIWRALLASTPPRARTGRPVATAAVSRRSPRAPSVRPSKASRRPVRRAQNRPLDRGRGESPRRCASTARSGGARPGRASSARRTGAMGRPEAGRWTPCAPAARTMSGRALTRRLASVAAAAERASVARARSSRSLQPLRRTCSASTPAAASAQHQRRQSAPGTTAGLVMASRRGIFKSVAGVATQEEIEVVETPDQVEKPEGGDHGTRPGGEQELAQGAERQQQRCVIPRFEPGRQQEKEARLHAVDEEDSAEERVGTHGRVDCSPPTQPAPGFGAFLALAVVLLWRRRRGTLTGALRALRPRRRRLPGWLRGGRTLPRGLRSSAAWTSSPTDWAATVANACCCRRPLGRLRPNGRHGCERCERRRRFHRRLYLGSWESCDRGDADRAVGAGLRCGGHSAAYTLDPFGWIPARRVAAGARGEAGSVRAAGVGRAAPASGRGCARAPGCRPRWRVRVLRPGVGAR